MQTTSPPPPATVVDARGLVKIFKGERAVDCIDIAMGAGSVRPER